MSLRKSSFLFSLGTLFSRLSGLVREGVLAHVFGAGHLMDAFNIGFRIPNLFRDMLAEGALGSAFTKVYSEVSESDAERARLVLIQSLRAILLILSIVIGLGILFAPEMVALMSLGAADDSVMEDSAIGVTRILFPFLGIASLNAILSGVLYQRGSFFSSAISPILGNLGYVFGALFLAQLFASAGLFQEWGDPKLIGLAIGVMVGACAQLAGIAWLCRSNLEGPIKDWLSPFWSKELGKILKLSLPMMLAASVPPINAIINTNFATSLGEGPVSWLNYGIRIMQLPVALFGVAVSVVALPSLTRIITKNNQRVDQAAISQLESALGLIFVLMGACFCFYYVNHRDIISLLFEHGSFDKVDSLQAGKALWAYSFGLIAYGIIKVQTAFYYAIEKTSYPLKVSFLSIIIVFVGSYLLVEPFGHMGLALASSLSLTVNALFLLLGTLLPFRQFFDLSKIFKTLAFAVLFGALSIPAQDVFSSMLMPWVAGIPDKLQISLRLLASGVMVLLCLILFLCLLYRESPLKLARHILKDRK